MVGLVYSRQPSLGNSSYGQSNAFNKRIGVNASGQVPFSGIPLVQNYTKATYLAANQNWSVSCGENGMLYFGNNDGLLSFDGHWWELYHMPGNIIVRSVATDKNGRTYTGGLREFGYWERDSFGQLGYHSLSNQLEEKHRLNDEVWKIYVNEEQVIFQSFSSIYVYKEGKLLHIDAPSPMLFLFEVNERYFVEALSSGLYELKNDKLRKVLSSGDFGNSRILTILSNDNGNFLIGTAQQGIYEWDGQSIKPWQNDAQEDLRRYQLNNGLKLREGHYAFGTILNGLYILNDKGRKVLHINKETGLQNNTILSLQLDKQQNIWAGLDNGIDRIEINSPIYYYNDKAGLLGTVYASIVYQNKLYLGTNQGLYCSDWSAEKSKSLNFKLLEGSQGQVWDLSLIDNELLCGHNNGTFKVNGDQLEWLSDVTGGYVVQALQQQESRLIQGTYTGLALFERHQHEWKFVHKIKNFEEPVQYLQQVDNNKFWISGYKGLYMLQLNATQDSVVYSRLYQEKDGLPKTPYVNVFNLAGKLVFSTDAGFYLYDEIADKFHVYAQLNERLGTFANANKVIPADAGNYWFIRKGNVSLVSFGEAGKVTIDSMQFSPLSNRMLNYYENVNKLADDLYLISLDDGFALYRKNDRTVNDLDLSKPLLQRVEDITDSTARLINFASTADLEIAYNKNNIRLTYALPHYSSNTVLFQYILEGYSKNWSEWTDIPQREFTNLARGKYVFKLRAKTVDGKITPVSSLAFRVLAPWYLSWPAWMVYGCLLIIGAIGVRKYYQYKLRKHREHVQQKLKLEQEERLRQEAQANEQRLMQLKNVQLEKELAGKNRELANSAMNIVYKNELLNNVHDELSQLKDSEGRKLSGEQLKKISKIIDDARSDERDWNLFEESFNEAHENFFKKLKQTYPELVPNDLKLCAYLRMNMSSKEIASLLNITTRGVEIRRYRLRKKLNLQHDQNLSEFLMEV
ncbi:transcriptional regulator [Olivibacter sp. SDN3]|nr:transcriptional regulator [Olivibacter sp. SDN3]